MEQVDAAGVPVLLLPGLADPWRAFRRLLPHLPAAVRAFTLTRWGHGDADRPATRGSWSVPGSATRPTDNDPARVAGEVTAFVEHGVRRPA